MALIQLQDLTVTINGTSRYNGNSFDTAHVEILLVTNEPIPNNQFWYAPSGVTVPPAVAEILKLTNLPMYPTSESKILTGIEDIKQQAEAGNLQEVINDSARLMLLSIFKKISLTPIVGSTNAYVLSYDYKLFPLKDTPLAYEFKVLLPFDGLTLNPAGGRVQVTAITPCAATIDPVNTKGVAPNSEITESISPVQNTNRQIVSFQFHLDPEFTIRYIYPQ